MSNADLDLIARAIDWSERARGSGWQSAAQAAQFHTLERSTPNELFAEPLSRPLVVAFFGGTGVGKSSLLNRLAGADIAPTGLERPTSHEVTFFVHEAIALADLPSALPIARVSIRHHANDALSRVLWIDTPDFDSTDRANRELVLACLPYLDVVVYVVSPERYRDDIGWEILRDRALKHAWIFVINRCDEGDPEQANDFTQSLRRSGFSEPIVLRTCCAPGVVAGCDQFAQLQARIDEVLDVHEVSEFEQPARQARLNAVLAAVREALATLGETAAWCELQERFQHDWREARRTILAGMAWPIATLAASLAGRKGVWSPSLVEELSSWAAIARARTSPVAGNDEHADRNDVDPSVGRASLSVRLWDEWAQSQLTQPLDQLEIRLSGAALPSKPLRSRLDAVLAGAESAIADDLQNALREALARPGTRLQRGLRRMTWAALLVLPLAAAVWVAHTLVLGFYAGATGTRQYLGVEFAVHSVLLILCAWLVPWLTHRLLCPSVEKTAVRALRVGLDKALSRLAGALNSAWQTSLKERTELRAEGKHLAGEMARRLTAGGAAADSLLTRLLATPDEARSQSEQTEIRGN